MSSTISKSHQSPVQPEQLGLGGVTLMDIVRQGAQTLLKEAVEEEVSRFLGRSRYERGDAETSRPDAYRNGHRKTRIDTSSGPIEYDRPRLAGAPEFKSQFHRPYMRRPEEFETAVGEMYVEGLSTRKVKKALKAVAGDDLKMSRSTVSRITEKLRAEFRIWKKRSLAEIDVAYLFVDAIRVGMRLENTRKQAVLVAYAVLKSGEFESISIGIGNEESGDVWGKFIGDLKDRGLKDPLLVVSDGNAGVIAAIENHFPMSYRQRCTKHKVDNVLSSVPKEKHDEVRPKLNRIFFGATSLEQAKSALEAFRREYRKIYPSAVDCLSRDIDQALTFYLFPSSHWRRIRTSNKLERMNLEIRRRLNVIGRHPSEDGCLALVYQISKRHAVRQRGFAHGDLVHRLWQRLKQQKLEMLTQLRLEDQAA